MKTFKIILFIVWTIFWIFVSEFVFKTTWTLSGNSGPYWVLIIYLMVSGAILSTWDPYNNRNLSLFGGGAIVSTVLFLIMISIGLGSTRMLNASKYQSLIGEIVETDFTSNIEPVDASQMLIVDKGIAERIGTKELGKIPGLGSRAKLSDFTLQSINGELHWIAPLVHRKFFSWLKFGKHGGTPGYVRVSATNQDNYDLVTEVNGKELSIKYQTGAFFNQGIWRHVYRNGYRSRLIGDLTFEVDDNWMPYWTITLYKTKIGFAGGDACGILYIDPASGVIVEQSIEEAEPWIDRIQPEWFISNQLDNWGRLIHGWWNLSHSDVLRVAEESSLVLGSDGRPYYYYGLTSSGSDESTVGFAMVDTRTKETHWFKQSGATEAAARRSAEGKVQEKGYLGSDGITYNIEGHPTYEFLLKDNGGLMKLVSLVNVYNHNIVGIGENRHEAIQDYRSALLSEHANAISIAGSNMDLVSITAIVKRSAVEVLKGNTYYYFMLDGYPDVLFTAGAATSQELSMTRPGDKIEISYIQITSGEIAVMTFDNLGLNFIRTEDQITKENNIDSIRREYVQERSDGVIEKKWEDLSTEEKRKLLDK